MMIRFKRLTPTATIPRYGSSGAAGMDLHADLFGLDGAPRAGVAMSEDGIAQVVIGPGERRLIPTGLTAELPEGVYARVAPRSGLAVKNGIHTLAGVIDPDYRGDYGIVAANLGDQPLTVRHGDRVAQLILERFLRAEIVEVDTIETSGTRGAAGFGSTGI